MENLNFNIIKNFPSSKDTNHSGKQYGGSLKN